MEKSTKEKAGKAVALPAISYVEGKAVPGWKVWIAPDHKIHWRAPLPTPAARGFYPTHIRENAKTMRGAAIAWTYWDGTYWRWPSVGADNSVYQICWSQNRYWSDAVNGVTGDKETKWKT